jgi:phosphoribosylanthranilate isomerase
MSDHHAASATKICGIKDEAALDTVIAAGVEYFGLVFFAKSPRAVDVGTATRLVAHARQSGSIKPVALLVDADDALIDQVVADVRPDVLQLHGEETVERVAEVRRRSGLEVWKAVAVRTVDDVAATSRYQGLGSGPGSTDAGPADMILFDAKPAPGAVLPGGNGLTFDWRILDGYPHPFVLAGGLTAENVAQAIQLVRPTIVDVSSGVESAPGVKDASLIRAFVAAVRVGAPQRGRRSTA